MNSTNSDILPARTITSEPTGSGYKTYRISNGDTWCIATTGYRGFWGRWVVWTTRIQAGLRGNLGEAILGADGKVSTRISEGYILPPGALWNTTDEPVRTPDEVRECMYVHENEAAALAAACKFVPVPVAA